MVGHGVKDGEGGLPQLLIVTVKKYNLGREGGCSFACEWNMGPTAHNLALLPGLADFASTRFQRGWVYEFCHGL